MKTKINISLFFVLISGNIFAQSTADIFKSEKKITWLGIDYSQVKLMGTFADMGAMGVKDESEIRDKYFKGWNDLVLTERDKKYNIIKALDKSDIPLTFLL